jgi:hypothetical protein
MEAVSRIANRLGICLYSTTFLDVDQTDLPQMVSCIRSRPDGSQRSENSLQPLRYLERRIELCPRLRKKTGKKGNPFPLYMNSERVIFGNRLIIKEYFPGQSLAR